MDGILEIKKQIVALIKQAAGRAQQEGKLPQVTLPEITVERPQDTGHGSGSMDGHHQERHKGKNRIRI